MKHIELFKNGFDLTVQEKIQPENYPYIGHDVVTGEMVYTLIPEDSQSGYQMVDLGLSIKWADRNVGATSPEEYGLYFSWGNTDGHTVDENGNVADGYSFDGTTYASTSGGTFAGSTLDAEHDAATVNMGGNWRMPTVEETVELVENTTQTVDTENGGMIFTSKTNGNQIFIPFAGYCEDSLLRDEGLGGSVWSSSVAEDSAESACALVLGTGGDAYGDSSNFRGSGQSVRGVHA